MSLPWPDNPYGFSTNTTIAQCNLTVAKAAGMSRVRRIMSWSNLEPSEGSFDAGTLAQLDSEVQLAYTNQLNYTLCLSSPPAWATTTFHNGCSNMNPSKVLATWQYLLNRYNGGGITGALIAAVEFANEGYDDVGFGNTCQSFENVVPVLQSLYPWVKANYQAVLVGTPAHFNLQAADYLSVQSSLYTGYYGNAKGLFDYSNFHWYGQVRNSSTGAYTGPDGVQDNGADIFDQAWRDLHAVDVSYGNGAIPVYCTETGIAVPGTSGLNTEADHAAYFVGGEGKTGVLQDAYNSGGVLSHLNVWTIQNSNGYSISNGCASITYLASFYAIQAFIAQYPTWPSSPVAGILSNPASSRDGIIEATSRDCLVIAATSRDGAAGEASSRDGAAGEATSRDGIVEATSAS